MKVQVVEKYFEMNFKDVMEKANKEYKFTKKMLMNMVNELVAEVGMKPYKNVQTFAKVLKEHEVKLENYQTEPTNPIKVAQKWAKEKGYDKMTNIECYVAWVLENKLHVEYENEAILHFNNTKKKIVNPDFKVEKKVIEVQGDYWHGNPKKYKKLNDVQKKGVENDKLKKEAYDKNGYQVLYVWEMEIMEEPEAVVEKIKNFVK